MLDIIGGSYIENCIEPKYSKLFGSGLRAAAALSNKGFDIKLHTCICNDYKQLLNLNGNTFNFEIDSLIISKTTEFDYYHPLSHPIPIISKDQEIIQIENIEGDNILYYGMIEANAKFNGDYVVYDPQNHISFKDTGSTAKHLALVLNKNEAQILSKIKSDNISEIGRKLLISECADVIIIKNGSQGAFVFENDKETLIPVFETDIVWPIGTGDIFSAVFAWQWMIRKESPHDSAYKASQFTGQYCQSRQLPLRIDFPVLKELKSPKLNKSIYLAGPFFSIEERWLITELRNILVEFGNNVFSPFHDVGLIETENIISEAKTIAKADLDSLILCDTVLAVLNGLDAGTLFEIGYAKSLEKKVVVFAQNVNSNDLTMLIGTDCEITSDFSTAVYKASW